MGYRIFKGKNNGQCQTQTEDCTRPSSCEMVTEGKMQTFKVNPWNHVTISIIELR